MLLSSGQILEYLTTNDKGAKAQVGYDLTLQTAKKIAGGTVLQQQTLINDYYEMLPNRSAAGKMLYDFRPGVYSLTFDQGIKLDSNHTGFIVHRSSVLRCGATITSAVYDPGFEVDQMGAVMFVSEPITIEKGARVAQLILLENHPASLYNGQFQRQSDVK